MTKEIHEVGDAPEAKIINLDEFRDIVTSRQSSTGLTDNRPYYGFVDDATYQASQKVVSYLIPGHPETDYVVYESDVSDRRHGTFIIKDTDEAYPYHFAVNRSREFVEAILGDLDTMDDTHRENLRLPLMRMYTVAHIARAILKAEYPNQRYCNDLAHPKIGEAEVNPGSIERSGVNQYNAGNQEWLTITRWRVASGIGLLAVVGDRRNLTREITDYLSSRLENISDYMRVMQTGEQLFGTKLPQDREQYMDELIGYCNPLNRFDIYRILNPECNQQ